jgi:hypothetical protein
LRRERRILAVFPSPPPGAGLLPSRDVVEWFENRGIQCVFTGEGKGVNVPMVGKGFH